VIKYHDYVNAAIARENTRKNGIISTSVFLRILMYMPNYLMGLVNIRSFIHAKGATKPYKMRINERLRCKKSEITAIIKIINWQVSMMLQVEWK